jgi:membrane associated rhomboid family serine protease
VRFTDYTTLIQFVTSIFLHGGWLHIISNMWFLWIFGDNVEGSLGHFWYLILYLASGVIGGLAQYLFMPDSNIPMLGASGAVAGALGAYFLLFPHHKIKTLLPILGFITFTNVSAYIMLGYWFVLQVFSGAMSIPGSRIDEGGVAFWAHVGGFVAGLIIGKIFARSEKVVLEGEVIG